MFKRTGAKVHTKLCSILQGRYLDSPSVDRRQCEVCLTLPGSGGVVPSSRGPGSSTIG